MASTTAKKPWADTPYRLIPVPTNQPNMPEHSCIHCASEMANAHNVLIRGLNAIVQQAPHVPAANEPGYQTKEVKDLLFYVKAWCKMVNHHHDTEESCIFPELEKFSGKPGLMDGAIQQHERFHGGMDRLLAYASETTPEKYAWKGPGGMKEIIDSFAEALTSHLYEEIDIFLGFRNLDSKALRETWDKGEVYAQKSGNLGMLYDIFPCVLGNADKTFEGSTLFPPLPWLMPYAIKYWFAAGNGAWKFNPCDFWGQPRELQYTPARL